MHSCKTNWEQQKYTHTTIDTFGPHGITKIYSEMRTSGSVFHKFCAMEAMHIYWSQIRRPSCTAAGCTQGSPPPDRRLKQSALRSLTERGKDWGDCNQTPLPQRRNLPHFNLVIVYYTEEGPAFSVSSTNSPSSFLLCPLSRRHTRYATAE